MNTPKMGTPCLTDDAQQDNLQATNSNHDDMSEMDIGQTLRNASDTINESEDQDQIYLSVFWSGGKVAAAYYDVESTVIYMMPDTIENEDFHVLRTVIKQVLPTCIVTSAKQDYRLLKALQPDNDEDVNDNVVLLPSIDFAFEMCKNRLLSMWLPGMPDNMSDSDRSLYLSSLIPMEHSNMVRAIGGLLKLLDKKRVGIELEEADMRIPVIGLCPFTMEGMMFVDENTYSALQIFQRECHPSVYKAASLNSTKEGLSLYGILNRCKSQLGSHMLRTWLLRPLRVREELEARLDAVAFFSNHRNIETRTTLQKCLKNIKNLSKVLVRMRDAQAVPADWLTLFKTVCNAIYIADVCRGQPRSIEIFRKVTRCFTEDLNRIANEISKIVNFEESIAQNRFIVKPNVDADLDDKKRTFNGLQSLLTQIARNEMDRLSEEGVQLSEATVVYIPQAGFQLSIPVTKELEENNYELPNMKFLYVSHATAAYKTKGVEELDRCIGDPQGEITDHETTIMLELQNLVLQHCDALLSVSVCAAELDCLITLGACANEGNYVRPEFSQENVIDIKAARHPLQELCCSPFVPNDIQSGHGRGKMKILTGPNASGKSVYLKQVALVAFMAQIGSFVPAEHAHLGLLDGIYTRIRTMESVSVGLSTFMIDINQVSDALQHSTDRSLVVLDEFGKGTDSVDGQALLCSTLAYWLRHQCPHVFVSTHYHSVSQYLPQSPLVRYQTMEVIEQEQELVFLYQLIDGSSSSSYACHVAAKAGLPAQILSRAVEVSKLIGKNQPVRPLDSASAAAQLETCKKIVENFFALNLEKEEQVKQFLCEQVLPARQSTL